MTDNQPTAVSGQREIASARDGGPAWWFLGTLAVLRNPIGAPRTPAVIELTIPPGGSPPRHVHDSLDDSFLLLDGELVVRCGERIFVARRGDYVALPAGIEHTFRVVSSTPSRLLLVHADESFLGLVEALGTPTTDLCLPPADEREMDPDRLIRATAEHGARVVGPSLSEDEARAHVEAGPGNATLGAINHYAINVTNLARSEQWYTKALDLIRVDGHVAEDGTGHVTLLSPAGGWVIALASSREPGIEHVALSCTDRGALVHWRETLAERDFHPGTITDAPYGSGFVLRDPDNLQVELFAAGPQIDTSSKED